MTPLNSIIHLLHTISSSTDGSTDTIKDKINDIVKKYLLNPIDVFNSFGMENFKFQYRSISNEVKSQLLKEIEEVARGNNEAKNAKKYTQEWNSFCELSDDVLLYIFQFLAEEDVFSISQVNKQFARIAQDPYIVLPYLERCINDLDFQTLKKLFFRYGENIKSLDLTIDKRFKNCGEAISLISLCPNLISLNLNIKSKYPFISSKSDIPDEGFAPNLEQKFDQLDNLHFAFKELTSRDIAHLGSLPSLENLSLYDARFNVREVLSQDLFKNLKKLELFYCEINDQELINVVGGMVGLKSLAFSFPHPLSGEYSKEISNYGLIKLAESIKKLESLSFENNSDCSSEGYQAIVQSNPNLTSLTITNQSIKNHDWLANIDPFPSLTSLKLILEGDVLKFISHKLDKLKSLNLTKSTISAEDLRHLAPYLKNLEILEFDTCYIDVDPFPSLTPNICNLTKLSLPSCHGLHLESLKSYVRNLPYLVNLDLSWSKLTNDQLIEIAPYLNKLKKLKLQGLLIDDNCFKEMAPHLHNIENLNLAHNAKLSSVSHDALCSLPKLRYLCLDATSISFSSSDKSKFSYIKNLTKLSLCGCNSLADECLKVISPFCGRLDILKLSNNHITIKGLGEILPHTKKLKTLFIQQCYNITYRDLSKIETFFKKFKILFSYDRFTNKKFPFEDLIAIKLLLKYFSELNVNFELNEHLMIEIAPYLQGIPQLCFDHYSFFSEQFLDTLIQDKSHESNS